MPGKLELGTQELRAGIDKGGPVALDQARRRQHTIKLRKLGLVVEQLQMARRPGHEKEDDPLRLRREMRLPRSLGVMLARGRITLLSEEMAQGDASQADAALLQEPAPGHLLGIGIAIEII